MLERQRNTGATIGGASPKKKMATVRFRFPWRSIDIQLLDLVLPAGAFINIFPRLTDDDYSPTIEYIFIGECPTNMCPMQALGNYRGQEAAPTSCVLGTCESSTGILIRFRA